MSLEDAIRAAQERLEENGELTIHVCKESIGLVARWDCELFPDTALEDSIDLDDLEDAIPDWLDSAEELVDERINRLDD